MNEQMNSRDILEIERQARELRAEALREGLRAFGAWIRGAKAPARAGDAHAA